MKRTHKFCPEVQDVIDHMTTKPETEEDLLFFMDMDKRIRGMKKSGAWDKLESFYYFGHDKKIALINWKE